MPGDDLLDDGVAAVNAVICLPTPRRPPATSSLTASTPICHWRRRAGDVTTPKTIAGGPSKVNDAVQAACAPRRSIRTRLGFLPHALEVANPAGHLADDVIHLPVLDQARPRRVVEHP